MHDVIFADGTRVPALGQGTWRMGEDPRLAATETRAIRAGVERGMSVIDTAEMYGDGATERFLGEALAGLRDRIFLVSKVYPQNAGRQRLAAACEQSLKRLKTDRIDLYLLHWRGSVALGETAAALDDLVKAGKIRAWGVSNFDVADLAELSTAGGEACATNQILYNLTRRGPAFALLPWMAERAMPFMAYSPVEQGRLGSHQGLRQIAKRHDVTPIQVALAWVLRDPNAIVIPKASAIEHVGQNYEAGSLTLGEEDLEELDAIFPAPRRKSPLAML